VQKTKSPIQKRLLRDAGQSLDRELDDHINTHLLSPLMVIVLSLVLVALEWWRHFSPTPSSPWVFTIALSLVIVSSVIWIWFAFKKAHQLKLGRDGERAVGQFLERFRAEGFQIYHDVVTGDANIDHVLIGSQGVYTVETKTLSKPERGQAKIKASVEGVWANGRKLDRNPIVQAKAQANWLKNYFAEAEFKVSVQPVVVFPGWFIESADFKQIGAWVLEPKALPKFIENAKTSVSPETTKALSLCLSNYIRTQSKL
jgi:hypothetical protein